VGCQLPSHEELGKKGEGGRGRGPVYILGGVARACALGVAMQGASEREGEVRVQVGSKYH
jgi:hypothetical protein